MAVTVRAAVEWSSTLLDPVEQARACAASVFSASALRLAAGDHDHKVVRVTDHSIGGLTMAAAPSPVDPSGHARLPYLGEVLIEGGQRDVGQQRVLIALREARSPPLRMRVSMRTAVDGG